MNVVAAVVWLVVASVVIGLVVATWRQDPRVSGSVGAE